MSGPLAIVLFALAGLPVLATIANLFIWRLYQADARVGAKRTPPQPPSWWLRLLVLVATIVNVACVYVAWIAITALLEVDPLPDWAVIGLGIALFALESVTVIIADELRRRARMGLRDVIRFVIHGGEWHS